MFTIGFSIVSQWCFRAVTWVSSFSKVEIRSTFRETGYMWSKLELLSRLLTTKCWYLIEKKKLKHFFSVEFSKKVATCSKSLIRTCILYLTGYSLHNQQQEKYSKKPLCH
ncbi:unnamed protein product [Acanthoscelides obtectus]|uniref:Uncharacterized protein n=1 Tax=Acanthoscelides obtectus TaxID=200917 RepID=A0A9P0LRT9_ACAOB|nr:unnamed protein product [Acanthoscelides obtectus]CAK1621402.1 hypothetical protein AOBTE_LOCUS929 [Acanthoscelides obtectus]